MTDTKDEKRDGQVVELELDEKLIKKDVDLAFQLAQQSHGIVIDEETNRRLLRKIDLWVCPILCLVYAIQFMDKVSNAGAAVMGLRTDLEMTGLMYSWVGTGFYLGYLVFEFPVSLALQRFPLAKTTGLIIIVWGIIMCCHAACKNFASFEALRVLLGALESGITPAFVIITGQWYRREEQYFRTSIWFGFNGLGTILSSSIAYGLFQRQETIGTPIDAWRILYAIMGGMTIFSGILFFLHMPDTPAQAWFLTEHERLQVVERIRDNKTGFGNRHFKWDQFKECFVDPRTYIMFIYNIASNIPNGSITNFSTILIEGMGYSSSGALLMNLPTGAVELVFCILFGFFARKFNLGLPVAIVGSVIFCLLSVCLLGFASNTYAQLVGVWLFGASPVPYICLLSNIASNTAGHTKKVTSNAIFLIGYCVGNMIGPQTFIDKQAPKYVGAKVSMVVCSAAQILALVALMGYYMIENKRRDRRDEHLDMEDSEFADLTDRQNPEFRYII
uniref:ARAD1B22616p n=1 Tax=Blastobotrys adeninivorans TaxID=409370 RepID=A0A060TD86_BLAAD